VTKLIKNAKFNKKDKNECDDRMAEVRQAGE